MYFGDYTKGTVVFIPFNTAGASGGSITIATNGTAKAYINGGTSEVTTGVTLVEDHDGITGRHGITVDTSGAPFTVGADVDVALDAATVDGQTINAWVGKFSIARESAIPAQVWAVLNSTLTVANTIGQRIVNFLDAAVSSRLATTGYTAPPTASANATAVRSEISPELGRIDTTISSRLAAGTLGSDVTAIKAKTDLLTFSGGNVNANIEEINNVQIVGNGASNPFDVA